MLDEQLCPSCGERVNAHAGADHDHKPQPEDVSVCVHCVAVLQFDDDLRLRKIAIESLPLETQRQLKDVIAVIRGYQARKN